MNLYSDCLERYIIVEDEFTPSGYRIISDHRRVYTDERYVFLVPTPDSYNGYIVLSKEYGRLVIYQKIVCILRTKHEADEWVHENKKAR